MMSKKGRSQQRVAVVQRPPTSARLAQLVEDPPKQEVNVPAHSIPQISPNIQEVLHPSPRIGQIVLFKIHQDPEVLRPLIVIDVHKQEAVIEEDFLGGEKRIIPARYLVSGQLLVLGDSDRLREWCKKYFFHLSRDTDFSKLVRNVPQGQELGQWRFGA